MTIDRNTYLCALGLFTLARHHSLKLEEFHKALHSTLGLPETGSSVSDAVYDHGDFSRALADEGIEIEL